MKEKRKEIFFVGKIVLIKSMNVWDKVPLLILHKGCLDIYICLKIF